MGITDTNVATGGLGYAIADAIIHFNKINVFWPLIDKKAVQGGAIYGRFPVYTKITASDVTANAAGAEGADTSATDIATSPVDIEVLRYSVRADLTDLGIQGNDDNIYGNTGDILGNAISAKFDNAVYADMSSSLVHQISSGSGALTMGVWFEAIEKLHTEGIMGPFSAVLSPKQIWGPYGLSSEIVQAGTSAVGTLADPGANLANNGFVGTLAGVNVYWSDQITENTALISGSIGLMFGKNAQGVAYKDLGNNGSFIVGETERNASGALTTIVANGYFNTDQLYASASVGILTQTSA